MKYEIGNDVKVVNYSERFDGLRGEVLDVLIQLDEENVYMIRYNDSNNKGMFPESSLELI